MTEGVIAPGLRPGHLLFHGCVPLNADGSLREITFDGKCYKGRAWFDFCERMAREAAGG